MGSTDVVEQLLFSIVSSILTFDFDFLLFGALMCNFWGQSRVENFLGVKLCFEKLLFSIVLSSYIYIWLLFYKFCSISALSCSFEFMWMGGGRW